MNTTTTTKLAKLWQVSLYSTPSLSQEEQDKIDNYNKIIWFQKQLEKDIEKKVNGGVNQRGERIDSNALIYEQLINVEMFASNAIAKDFGFDYADILNETDSKGNPIGKFQNKKILNNGAQLQLSSEFSLDAYKGPLEHVQTSFIRKQIKENQALIDKYQSKLKSRNISKKQLTEKIKELSYANL